jgi:hypothetical protein
MRTVAPQPFSISFAGPEGSYTIHFRPDGEWDGLIDVTIGGLAMLWPVEDIQTENGGHLVISGLTKGTEDLWNQQLWFELRLHDSPPIIRYWGDKVVWREDAAVELFG